MVVNGTSNVVNYGTCSTAAATAVKVVSCSNFALITGAEITVKFTTTNTAANPTLNVNNTGAKAIYYRGSAISAGYLAANRTYTFRYNGSQYDLVGDINTDTNTKVTQTLTTSNASYPLLLAPSGQTATTTTTSYFDNGVTLNPSTNTIAANISGNAATADTAQKAVKDKAGNSIDTFYLPLSAGESKKLTGPLGLTENINYGTSLPDEGFVGQLFFVEDENLDGSSLPIGGAAGQVLVKNSSEDGDASWATDISGNAATATKLATARTISLTGDVTGSGAFDGSDNLSITAIVADDSHNHSSAGAINTINPASQSIVSRITYISGGFNLGTGNNQIQLDGMTGNPNHISAPTAGCYNNGTYGNVQVVRFGWPSTNYWTELYMSPNYDGFWHSSVKNGTRSSWKRIWMQGDAVTGAVWNDYAECRESDCEEFGYVLMETGDDSLTKTTERLSHFAGVSSDTWGFSQGETDKAKTPIAVAGRVLVYPYQDRNNYKPGDCVCAAPGGTVDIMTREEVREWPDRIVGTVSCVPDYEEWGGGEGADRDPVKVNGRIWIKVR